MTRHRPQFRQNLPQLSDKLFLTDGGLETTLCFIDGIDLPEFAAFDMLKDDAGVARLLDYFDDYVELAHRYGAGFILESVTWRANGDWSDKIGYSRQQLADFNRKSIDMLLAVRDRYQTPDNPFVISGCIGPRGDGYWPDAQMSAADAQAYHQEQITLFADTPADMVSALTLNYPEEATGICLAAAQADIPAAISFTVETDGKLPNGDTLQSAIEAVDDATDGYAAYYMINCAHPTHFDDVLTGKGVWQNRLRGIRANASRKSHAELDESETLDQGDPVELGTLNAKLKQTLPHLTIFGGCCGTDHRHVDEIGKSCAPLFRL